MGAAFSRPLLLRAVLVIGMALCGLPAVAGITLTYVKTLGQTNATGTPLHGTGYRLSVDAAGNVYTVGMINVPWTSAMKLSPDGRVLWETECGGYNYVCQAVDGNAVYTQSRVMARRYNATTGVADPDWVCEWTWKDGQPAPVSQGIRGFKGPRAMLADGDYLYIVDRDGDELRRLSKTTGEDKPFAMRLMAVKPMDLAKAKNGNLLLLTDTTVVELDRDGKPVHVPLISDVEGAIAIDVSPVTGNIYLAMGGPTEQPINQIVEYSPDGKATGVRIGQGGDFSGTWSPLAFAFSSGEGDIACDPKGGIWVNNALGQIVHLTGQTADRMFGCLQGVGLTVDGDLNVYLGLRRGVMKLTWDNKIAWTSGMHLSPEPKRFPSSPVDGWPVLPKWAGPEGVWCFNYNSRQIYALSPATGTQIMSVTPDGPEQVLNVFGAGKNLHLAYGEPKQFAVTQSALAKPEKWEPFFTPPADIQGTVLAASPSRQLLVVYSNNTFYGVKQDGTVLWQLPSGTAYGYSPQAAFLRDEIAIVNLNTGPVVAMNARTGEQLVAYNNQPVAGRPAMGTIQGLATQSKDGHDYLFLLGGVVSCQIQVFEVSRKQ